MNDSRVPELVSFETQNLTTNDDFFGLDVMVFLIDSLFLVF